MKSLTEHLWFEVPARRGFINITPKIEELVHRSGVTGGICLVNAMHIAASISSTMMNPDSGFQLSGIRNSISAMVQLFLQLTEEPRCSTLVPCT